MEEEISCCHQNRSSHRGTSYRYSYSRMLLYFGGSYVASNYKISKIITASETLFEL